MVSICHSRTREATHPFVFLLSPPHFHFSRLTFRAHARVSSREFGNRCDIARIQQFDSRIAENGTNIPVILHRSCEIVIRRRTGLLDQVEV